MAARTAKLPGAWLVATALTGALALPIGIVAAGDDGKADERLQALTVELKKYDVADDTHHAATAELGKAEALRDKARSLMGERRERDVLARAIDELEATLSLVEAKILHADAKTKLDKAKADAATLDAEVAKVRGEADALEKQQEEMQRKIGGGK